MKRQRKKESSKLTAAYGDGLVMSSRSNPSGITAPAMIAPKASFHLEELDDVAEALLLGLAMYGDLMERENAVEILRLSNCEVPETLVPVHPTGCVDIASTFASALRTIIPARHRVLKNSQSGAERVEETAT